MPKDGPAISSGYRYSGRAALQAGLPASAISAKKDMRAGEDLVAFRDYHKRARALGQPTPETLGVSPERAAALQRATEQQQEDQSRYVLLANFYDGLDKRLDLASFGRWFLFVEEDKISGKTTTSWLSRSKEKLRRDYENGNAQVLLGWALSTSDAE